MEQHFLDVGKPAWDSADWARQPQPPWLLIPEDSGPWSLPLYPVLGECAGNYDAYGGRLLCSPCWQLPSVYGTFKDLTAAQSSWEGSPAQPSLGPSPETLDTPDTPDTPETPGTPGTPESPAEPSGEPVSAKETAFELLSETPWPSARDEGQGAHSCEGARPAERRPPRARVRRCGHADLSSCLRWIRRAVCSLSRAAAGCCGVFLDVKEP